MTRQETYALARRLYTQSWFVSDARWLADNEAAKASAPEYPRMLAPVTADAIRKAS